jgi:D-glycero-alpha-D-manno-heptose-7-phosphate kinase
VNVSPLQISEATFHDLQDHLLMFFTGFSRAADKVLEEQRAKSTAGDSAMIDNLHYVKKRGQRSQATLEQGDCEGYAALTHEHREHKKKRAAMMSNPNIDRWYTLGRENGALGGKLVGAGAGGFLLFYTQELRRLRSATATEGQAEVRFSFDNDSSVVLIRS